MKDYYLKDHLSSIRAVINESNAIVSAQDYDMWGYELEGRNYYANDLKYKFTVKERDNESGGYDYFGARYYDSRIGRWLEVEPKLENYIAYSPYLYSLANPLYYRDVNGQDAIFEIDEENKKINISIFLHYSKYSKDNTSGLTNRQIEFLKYLKDEVEDLWSGNVDNNVEEFAFNVIVELVEESSFSDVVNNLPTGHNFVQNINFDINNLTEENTGLGAGSLSIVMRKDFHGRKFSESHEIGHLLGLNDKGDYDKSVMGYHLERVGPKAADREEVIKNAVNLDLTSTKPQIVRGFVKK